ncbi:MAG: ATP-binding protein [Mucilaginibacter sp.]|uniref:PAS domain-containing sensor histidine kinase n=1 Tax=Mucilaginibacter sp. TaxID=1882438 RepID=UPI0031AD2013
MSLTNEQLLAVLDQSKTATAIYTTEDIVIESANKAMLAFWDRDNSIIGLSLDVALPEIKNQPFMDMLRKVFTTGIDDIGEAIRADLVVDGRLQTFYFDYEYRAIRNPAGEVYCIIHTAVDVTERELAKIELTRVRAMENAQKKALMESEDRFRALVTSTSDMIYSMSADLYIMYQLDGRGFLSDTTEPIDDWISKYIHPDDQEKVKTAAQKAFRNKEMFELEHRVLQADGKIGWTQSRAVPILNDQGEIMEWFGAASDVTNRKMEEERKSDFIGMVSHELKTPLTSLSAYLQMLQGKSKMDKDTFTLGALDQSVKQVRRMTTMINGFLNVSRLESSKINIDRSRFDMAGLVEESEAEAIPMFSSHQLVFAPVEETYVNADRDKISQVINNLISNAVKYSKQGSMINIACITVNGSAQVSVRDKGIGIKQEEISRLFERYYRVEGSQHIAGFGIGLYLCCEIIKRHEGKIWAESELGCGSTFYFSLPVVA